MKATAVKPGEEVGWQDVVRNVTCTSYVTNPRSATGAAASAATALEEAAAATEILPPPPAADRQRSSGHSLPHGAFPASHQLGSALARQRRLEAAFDLPLRGQLIEAAEAETEAEEDAPALRVIRHAEA